MNNVLEEVTSDTITKTHVENRLRDWIGRIENLYSLCSNWLPAGVESRRESYVRMNEEMMTAFEVSPVKIPVLEIYSKMKKIGRLEPRGLWIVGANGRVDLFGDAGHHIMVDHSPPFSDPVWKIANFDDRQHPMDLSEERFKAALGL